MKHHLHVEFFTLFYCSFCTEINLFILERKWSCERTSVLCLARWLHYFPWLVCWEMLFSSHVSKYMPAEIKSSDRRPWRASEFCPILSDIYIQIEWILSKDHLETSSYLYIQLYAGVQLVSDCYFALLHPTIKSFVCLYTKRCTLAVCIII